MKALLLLVTVGLLSSCGLTEGLNKNCGSSVEMACNLLFGMDDEEQDQKIADNTFKNNEQDARLKALEEQNEQLIESMDSFSEQLEQLGDDDVSNKNYLEGLITTLTNTVTSNSIQLVSISNTLTTLQGTIVTLESTVSKTIIATIDPCGDYPGHFDEVLLKTKDNKYIAYFEQSGKRFLTILTPGQYMTTDSQNCPFQLTNNNEIVY